MASSLGIEGANAIDPGERPRADDPGAALDRALQPLDRAGRVQLWPVLLGEGHAGRDVVFGRIRQHGEPRHLWPDLVGDGAPPGAGGLGRVFGEGGGGEGRDHPSSALSGMGKGVALEMEAAPQPGGTQNLRDGGLDALMGITDHQLHVPQVAPDQLARGNPIRIGAAPEMAGYGPEDSAQHPGLRGNAPGSATARPMA